MTEEEAQARVDALWAKCDLKSRDSMTLEKATPFIQEYMREMKGVKEVDSGLVMQIFNEIDADGNQTIDQREMFNFIKNQEFRDSNLPEQSLKRQNSLV